MVLMKYILLFGIVLILMFSIINAQVIKIGVKETIDKEIGPISYNQSVIDGPFKVSFELFNTGSTGYKTRVRLDVFKENSLVFNGWSKEYSLNPGVRSNFEIYWYPLNLTGDFTGRMRVYYANEIEDLDPIEFEIKNEIVPEDVIKITDFRTFEEEVVFEISSSQNLDNVIIIPSNYPLGWIFELKKIGKLNRIERKDVELHYEPTLWKSSDVTINVITEDGKYYTSESFTLERAGLLRQFLYDFSKLLSRYLSIIL